MNSASKILAGLAGEDHCVPGLGAACCMVAKLIVVSGKSAGRAITLKSGKLLIGRAEDCDIRPLGEEVSRRHCVVLATATEMTVEDLKSRNGTFVNGVKTLAKPVVSDGDILRVGPLELKVSVGELAHAAPVSAEQVSSVGKTKSVAAHAPVASPVASPVVEAGGSDDDVSRWLMVDDEPAGMFDTTQSVKLVSPLDAFAVSGGVASGSADATESGSVVSLDAVVASGDSSATVIASHSGMEALIASRAKPGMLPAGSKDSKTDSSRDAAAEALKKFFGKR